MSVLLRDAVRELLADVEVFTPIADGSRLAEVRRLVQDEELFDERRDLPPAERLQIVALVDALHNFKKPGGHYIGCTADKTGGLCAPACRRAQLAVDPALARQASATIDRLLRSITALEADRRSLRKRLRQDREYLRRLLKRAKAETGFEVRRPGRPRKGHRPQDRRSSSAS